MLICFFVYRRLEAHRIGRGRFGRSRDREKGESCMKKAALAAVVAALMVLPVAASADDKGPDAVGTWEGVLHGMSAGGGSGPISPNGSWEKPAMEDGKVTIRVTGQEGRYFWGERAFNNGYKVNFIAMFSGSGTEFMGIGNTGAHYWGKVDDGRMQMCTMHTPMESFKRFDLNCSNLTRTK
jgi:hypothetical protein